MKEDRSGRQQEWVGTDGAGEGVGGEHQGEPQSHFTHPPGAAVSMASATASPRHLSTKSTKRLPPPRSLCLRGSTYGKRSPSALGRGHSMSKGPETGRTGAHRSQAVTWSRCDQAWAWCTLVFCSCRNPAACTCSVQGPAGNTHGASVQWEEKVRSPPKTEGKGSKDPEEGDSWGG